MIIEEASRHPGWGHDFQQGDSPLARPTPDRSATCRARPPVTPQLSQLGHQLCALRGLDAAVLVDCAPPSPARASGARRNRARPGSCRGWNRHASVRCALPTRELGNATSSTDGQDQEDQEVCRGEADDQPEGLTHHVSQAECQRRAASTTLITRGDGMRVFSERPTWLRARWLAGKVR